MVTSEKCLKSNVSVEVWQQFMCLLYYCGVETPVYVPTAANKMIEMFKIFYKGNGYQVSSYIFASQRPITEVVYALSIESGDGWVGSERDYTYDELLERAFNQLREKNPEMATGEKKKFIMKPPQVQIKS